jgi:hypothetical protein
VAALELTTTPRARVVVLGASNVSRGLSRLMATVAARSPDAHLLVAAGHGRSYGANSRVWMRRLPSLLHCGLWRALDRGRGDGDGDGDGIAPAGSPPLHALVTDVGNDLLYGFPAEQVAEWVREAVRRLAARGATVALTRLPIASIAGVGEIRYAVLRAVFVPGCRLSLAALAAAAARLDDALGEIAAEFHAVPIDQPAAWYGLDAIHVRRRHLTTLFGLAGDAWGLPGGRRPRPSWAEWAAAGTRGAEVRSLAGVMRFTPQPVVRLPGGGPLSLY